MSKYLVYYDNSFTLLGKEYFTMGEKNITTYHDPRKATLFETKKEAEAFKNTFYMEAKIDLAEEHFKLFVSASFVYRTLPYYNKELNRKYNGEDKTEVIKWWMAMRREPDFTVSQVNYGSWPNLYSVCDHLWSASSYYGPEGSSQMLYTFEIYTQQKGTFKNFQEELSLVLHSVTYEENGYRKLPIFDHELSEFEKRYLYYKNDKDCKIGSRYTMTKGTLEECFNVMRQSYYYNR